MNVGIHHCILRKPVYISVSAYYKLISCMGYQLLI